MRAVSMLDVSLPHIEDVLKLLDSSQGMDEARPIMGAIATMFVALERVLFLNVYFAH